MISGTNVPSQLKVQKTVCLQIFFRKVGSASQLLTIFKSSDCESLEHTPLGAFVQYLQIWDGQGMVRGTSYFNGQTPVGGTHVSLDREMQQTKK